MSNKKMGTRKQGDNVENRDKSVGAEFHLSEVRRMTSLAIFNKCIAPIYQMRIMNKVENSRSWSSQLFPVNHDKNFGKLRLTYSKGYGWNLTMALNDFGQEESSDMNSSSYFVFKYKYNVDTSELDDDDDGNFCKQIIVFGTGKNKASVSWHYDGGDLHSILIEVYQVPAAIPNFFLTPNNNMILGKIEKFNQTRTAENATRLLGEQPCFIFGSAAQQMTVSFMTNQKLQKKNPLGLTATLHVVNERASLVPSVPFLVTFTIFSPRRYKMDDLVKKIVVRREEKKFDHGVALAFYAELDNMMVNDTLYFKVVLEPLNGN